MTDLPAAPDTVLPTPDKRVSWTRQRLDRATAMWRAGHSGLTIAVALGTTRSAVMGKLIRLGLRRGPVQEKADKASNGRGAMRLNRENREPWFPPPQPQPRSEAAAKAIPFIALERHHCRWPVGGEGATTLFCGGNAHAGYPYCAAHCRMAYQRWGVA
jgi:GcrA cell cycle regulator